jgi:ribonucleoside-diphosphate reductase alpha chain
METILTKEILQSDFLQQYIFDYIEENDNIINDRNVLVVLDYLGYKWKWNEEKLTISNISKGKNENISIINIEDVIEETMDIETETTHSYKVNSLISHNTINLPADATREEISEVYLKAHAMGVIGVTVYRDGCRDGVLVHSVKDNKEAIVKTNAPKRPKSIPCHVYRVTILNKNTNLGEKWIIFVGLLNNEPYEVIAGKINGHDFNTEITEGEMVKTKKDGKKVYQFTNNGEVLCDDVCGQYLNPIREFTTRLMSLALRHGAGVEHLQVVLKKSGTIVDFNQAIGRSLSRYIKEKNMVEKCPACNSKLIYVEGCIKCENPECSWSKCS